MSAGTQCRWLTFVLLITCDMAAVRADEFPSPVNSQAAGEHPPSPEEMLALFELPDGFEVTLFAGEPDVQQPIAFDFDDRGRIWVAENYTYDKLGDVDSSHRDRIVILEDTDHDGRHDVRKVFWDQGSMLTSLAWGFGGLWILNDGTLSFLADRDGDDVADGHAQVMLNGWTKTAGHNFVSGLMWGPDGWLYGRHGITDTSMPGTPDTPHEARTPMNCGIWRFHPTQHVFEVVCRGTTNPWGMDYDRNGQLFMSNNVIAHLWHVIPGAHYQRMFGQDVNPHLYELMEPCSDHYHWDDTGKWTESRDGRADDLGGGHSHCGGMIYYGHNFPAEYQGKIFMCNTHGRCVNVDRLERHGGTFKGRHEDNFLKVKSPWFRGIELKYGPHGCVYLSDWADNGECHDRDGVHRTSGRIYRISYAESDRSGWPKRSRTVTDTDRVQSQMTHSDDAWHRRRHYRQIMERAADRRFDSADMGQLLVRALAEDEPPDAGVSLAWLLKGLRSFMPDLVSAQDVRQLLGSPHEDVRAVAVGLVAEDALLIEALGEELVEMSKDDRSPVVRMGLASALRRLPNRGQESICIRVACGLVIDSDAAATLDRHPQLRRLTWYGLERGYQYFGRWNEIKDPTLRRWYVRRWASDWEKNHQDVSVALRRQSRQSAEDKADLLALLQGMQDGLRGRTQVRAPLGWNRTAAALTHFQDIEIDRLLKELSVTFGDGSALTELRAIAADRDGDHPVRSRAIAALAAAHDLESLPVLLNLLSDRAVYVDVAKALASFDDARIPKELLKRWQHLRHGSREAAIDTLCSRRAYAQAFVGAVGDGRVDPHDISASQVRQLLAFGDASIDEVIESRWGTVNQSSKAKAGLAEKLRKQLTPQELSSADFESGAALFRKTCAACHKLYGEGGTIGPDLTGSNRGNLAYLLENIIDPSLVVPRQFTVSIIALTSGQQVTGVVVAETPQTVTVQTEKEQRVIAVSDVEERKQTAMSLMPDELLSSLSDVQVRDLIAYVMNPR